MNSAEGYEEIYRILCKADKELTVSDMKLVMEICEAIESDAYRRGLCFAAEYAVSRIRDLPRCVRGQ